MTPLDALRLQVAAMRIHADQLEQQADLVKDAGETEEELMVAVKLASDCLSYSRAARLIETLADMLEGKPVMDPPRYGKTAMVGVVKAYWRAKGLKVVQ